jgi:hypothetical protein
MSAVLPSRLLGHVNGDCFVFDPRSHSVNQFDIISYRRVDVKQPCNCGIRGMDWDVTISKGRLDDIKRLMIIAEVQYLWVACLCINPVDTGESTAEIAEYFNTARKRHILLDMIEVWDP